MVWYDPRTWSRKKDAVGKDTKQDEVGSAPEVSSDKGLEGKVVEGKAEDNKVVEGSTANTSEPTVHYMLKGKGSITEREVVILTAPQTGYNPKRLTLSSEVYDAIKGNPPQGYMQDPRLRTALGEAIGLYNGKNMIRTYSPDVLEERDKGWKARSKDWKPTSLKQAPAPQDKAS